MNDSPSIAAVPAVAGWLHERTNDSAALRRAQALGTKVQELGLDRSAVTAAWLVGARSSLSGAATSPKTLDPPQLEQQFGREVSQLVDAVERVEAIRWRRLEEEPEETLRRAFLAMARDVRAVLLALALRLQRLQEALALLGPGQAPPETERQLALEALEVHAPLANRLGVWHLKWPLENAALQLSQPELYLQLERLLAETREQREARAAEVTGVLETELKREGLPGEVSGRSKHIYSVYRKMQRKQVSFEQIYDLLAVRVITDSIQHCYAILGLVHNLWVPLPGELDDYIARPKPNGYQSLHTAVIGPAGRAVEVQIRTREMHQFAEHGVAAHWAYKEQRDPAQLGKRFSLLRELVEMERRESNRPAGEEASDLAESMRNLLFDDQVFVFTPRGDIVELPEGSTPLDFAYRVHTEIGHRCRGARVNDQIAPLTYRLRTGDRVEVLTQREASPSRDWMRQSSGFLRSARARAKVRAWFRQAREQQPTPTPAATAPRAEGAAATKPVPRPEKPPNAARGIVLDDVDDVLGARAKCCQPLPGDAVVGFITRGRGLTLHRKECPQLEHVQEPERLVEVKWRNPRGAERERYSMSMTVQVNDDPHTFSRLAQRISQDGAVLHSARQTVRNDGSAVWLLQLQLRDLDHAEQVTAALKRVTGVANVERA